MRRTFGIRAGLLLGAALATAPAYAQTTETPPEAPAGSASVVADQGDGDIVVTARRRAESVIDVPIAMSVVTGDQLTRTGAVDITALQDKTPNLTLQIARGSNSTLIAFSRGVGQQDPLWGFEPGVGLYLDDVYVARPQGAVLDIFDVERVEVLRGPQGTLYAATPSAARSNTSRSGWATIMPRRRVRPTARTTSSIWWGR